LDWRLNRKAGFWEVLSIDWIVGAGHARDLAAHPLSEAFRGHGPLLRILRMQNRKPMPISQRASSTVWHDEITLIIGFVFCQQHNIRSLLPCEKFASAKRTCDTGKSQFNAMKYEVVFSKRGGLALLARLLL